MNTLHKDDLDEPSPDLQPFLFDGSLQMVFTGYFNGFNVEVRSPEEVVMLYHMGCFGKGSQSRSRPQAQQTGHKIMRKRQFAKREYWYKKFNDTCNNEVDSFLKDVLKLSSKMKSERRNDPTFNVIDLVSSDEEASEESHEEDNLNCTLDNGDNDIVVVVPNSDSEGENYFENFKPKCCINKTILDEKLMLTLQEAFFLTYALGCLQIVGVDKNILNVNQVWDLFIETENGFIEKYVVYHYFRSKGYIVKPGLKYGGDYLLYRGGPGISHADYIVVIKSNKEPSKWVHLLGHVRMATTTVKEIVIAEVCKTNEASPGTPLPLVLTEYSVREVHLSRNVLKCNDD